MMKVAILEDDARIARFITLGLETEFYQAESFSSFDEFMKKLEKENFDVLIMDRMIGRQDALQCITGIRAVAPNIKIITLLSLAGSLKLLKRLDIAVDDYLEKPFRYEDLSSSIKNITCRDLIS